MAIKALREDLASDPDIVGRFVGESQVLRRISHPNVVGIRDLVVEGDQLGIVMDLVPGGSLRSVLGSRPLGPREATDLVAEIADGLQAVHDAGVAHRDLKPENILCAADQGRLSPRITDFGISRLMSKARTSTSQLIGTPIYMAPELSHSQRPTDDRERHRQALAADIYALGVILFELLARRPPFLADDPVALVMAHREAPVPTLAGLPPSLTRVLMAMLDKDWRRRPASPTEVAAALRAASPEVDPAATVTIVESPSVILAQAGTEALNRDEFAGALPLAQEAVTAGPRSGALKWVAAAVAGLVGAVALAGGGWLAWSQLGSEPEALTSAHYAFVPVEVADGVVVNRTWTLEGDEGERLVAEVTVTNSGSSAQTLDHVEVIPKEVAADVALISFDPEPDEIINPDPIVRFHIADLAAEASHTIRYSVAVSPGGATTERVADLAQAQMAAESVYRTRAGAPRAQPLVSSLELVGSPPAIVVGESSTLELVGTDDDGQPVDPGLLSTVVWTSSDVTVVVVDDGMIHAIGPGSATVGAQLGSATASMLVVVTDPEGGGDGEGGETDQGRDVASGGSDGADAGSSNGAGADAGAGDGGEEIASPTTNTTEAESPDSTSGPTDPPAQPPSTPTGVVATAGNGQATVDWNPASANGSAVTGYEIQSSTGSVVGAGASATSVTITGLTNGQSYTFTVRATSAAGSGGWSSPSGSVTPSSVPLAPSAPSASLSGASATVTWSAPNAGGSPVTGYELTSDNASGTKTDTGSPYTWTGLSTGTSYRFRVRACNANGCGAWSGYSNTVTPSTTPSAPATPSASAGNAQASISWSAPSSGGSPITGYELTSDNASGTKTDTASPYTWTGLSNGTTYRFRVRACNANGCGAWSGYSSGVRPSTVPAKVATPSASAGNARATISWSAPNNGGSGITGYELTSDVAAGTKTDGASPYTWTGLSNGATYRFRVRACNANGCGAWSNYSAGVKPVAPKVISLSRGGPINGGYWYSVSLSGFSPGSSVTVACHDSITSSFWTQSFTISGSGTASDSTLCWSADGPAHWVTGGGVTSNTVNW